MKITTRTPLLFVASILAAATAWAGDSDKNPVVQIQPTLFRAGEVGLSTFGEAGNGNVDVDPTQTVTHTTTTTTTVVNAPATPQRTPPITAGLRRASTTSTTTTTTSGGVTRTTTRTTRISSHDRIQHNAAGGGVALQYFFTRYIGVRLEGDFLGGYGYNTVAIGNLIFRYPFEFGASSSYAKDRKSTVSGPTWGIAPYILGGGGGQWDGRPAGIGDVGGGVEFRFGQHYGIYAEGRWIIHDSRQNYASEILGVTYTF